MQDLLGTSSARSLAKVFAGPRPLDSISAKDHARLAKSLHRMSESDLLVKPGQSCAQDPREVPLYTSICKGVLCKKYRKQIFEDLARDLSSGSQ